VVVNGLLPLSEMSMSRHSSGLEGHKFGITFSLSVGGCLVGIICARLGRGCRVVYALCRLHSGLALGLNLLGCGELRLCRHRVGGGLCLVSQTLGYVGVDHFGALDGLEVSLHGSISRGLTFTGYLHLACDAILVGLPALGGRDGGFESDGCSRALVSSGSGSPLFTNKW